MTPELRAVIAAVQPLLPERPYQEAVNLGRLAEWWRDVATGLLRRAEQTERLREAVHDLLDLDTHADPDERAAVFASACAALAGSGMSEAEALRKAIEWVRETLGEKINVRLMCDEITRHAAELLAAKGGKP